MAVNRKTHYYARVLLKGWTEQPRKNTTAALTATMLMVLGGLIWGHTQIHKILAKEKQLEMLAHLNS